jgi:cytochrome bd-type quinol oxidase subunit 2
MLKLIFTKAWYNQNMLQLKGRKNKQATLKNSMKNKLLHLLSYSTLFSGILTFFSTGITNAAIGDSAPKALVSSAKDLNTSLFCPIISAMFWILISLSIVMVLWAAYLYVIAQEDTEKTNKARRTLTYAAVAIIVALLAKGFPDLVSSIFPSYSSGAWGICS